MSPTHIHFGSSSARRIAKSWHIFLQREKNRESFPYESANLFEQSEMTEQRGQSQVYLNYAESRRSSAKASFCGLGKRERFLVEEIQPALAILLL